MACLKIKKEYCLVAALFLILIFFVFFNKISELNIAELKYQDVEIKGKKIISEVVSEPVEQYRGLSFREDLCANCGMLFVFPDKEERQFVMRNMNFPLDILFIDDDKIINIAADLPPEGSEPVNVYVSGAAVNYVLELPAGFCRENEIVVGDMVKINN